MDILKATAGFRTIQVRSEQGVCYIRLHRPEADNTINGVLIEEVARALDQCEQTARVVVLEGSPEVFCLGADFKGLQQDHDGRDRDPEPLYELWRRIACGPYVTVAHVRGKVNAGGVGFVAACDVVLSEEKAVFSLSEMLFGLMPACVLPFLLRRVSFSRANYLTLTTQPISARQAREWGLVDVCEENSENLLRKHLLRLNRLTRPAIARYKRYMSTLDQGLSMAKPHALRANVEVFSDRCNLDNIARYVNTGQFPWETQTVQTHVRATP
jgi:polyketide biosynthesis enoyl-CoA hydratase PksH